MKKYFCGIFILALMFILTFSGLAKAEGDPVSPTTVNIAAIPGVTPPAAGGTPVTSITETEQYTGSVSWSPGHDLFQEETVYTATITLSVKAGFTLEGVTADFFTAAGADTVNNEADSGIVTVVFPPTEGVPDTPQIGGTVEITGEAKFGNTLEVRITELYYTPDTPETGLDMPTCQWKSDAVDIAGATGSTYELTAEDIGKIISVTITADGVHATGSFTGSLTDVVAKADGPAAPAAPTLASRTDSTITLNAIEGAQYNVDDGPWQDSTKFTGLEPETAYEFRARIKETATHLASASSEVASISSGEEVFAGGNGSVDSPYLISTAEQLAALSEAEYLDKYFILVDDIDLLAYLSEGGEGWNDGAGWLPVGTSGAPFTGSFDGDGHSIENLFIERPGTNYIGLFGYIGSGADISNVDLVAVDVTGASSVGGLVGYNNGGAITACSAAGEVVGNMIDFLVGSHVGALVGYNKSGTVEACSAGGSVEGAQSVGGLVGYNTGGSTITGSWAAADVTGSGSNVGGLAGYNDGSTITGSWASGTVTGSGANSNVGGLVGINKNNSTIEKSWASGTVTVSGGGSDIGGLVGENWFYATINQSWATGNVEGSGSWNNTGGLVGYNNANALSAIISDSYATGIVKNYGTSNTGGLVGYNDDTKSVISGSYASGVVLGTDNDSKVGGLVGLNDGVITESQALGSVTGSGNVSYVGGLVGRNGWSIEKSKASGSVVGIGSQIRVGGLVGYHQHTIYNSYATGSVTENGTDGTGGLVGVDDGTIRYSYSIGTVVGSGTIGGLVGKNYFTPVSASFWDTQASGQSDSDGGTGKTTAEMKTYATFYNAGWDFIDEIANGGNSIWGIDESQANPDNNGYPFLAWEGFDHKVRPAVTTGEEVSDLAATTAVVQGEITCLGYPHAAQHGVCWSTEEDPTVDDAKTQEGEVLEAGTFICTLTGLEEETTYYVKAYVINELGTYYGEQVQFTTPALATVDIAAIPGVTPPAAGQIPVTSITETEQYSGSVSWNPDHDPFQNATVYTAIITLSAKGGYTLEGVSADFFTAAGANTVNNEADSGVVTAVFPATEAPQYITVTGTNPANGAADISQTPAITVTFSENIEADAGYAGIKLEDAAENDVSISKSINSNVLTITPQSALSYSTTYTVTLPADALKSTDTETNLAEEYLFSFTIQSAPAPATVNIAAIPGVTPPAAGQIPVTSITETDPYTGSVSWNPDHDPFQNATVYTATITLSAKAGFTLEGVTADFFTVAGADTVNNEADSGVVTAVFPATEAPQYITVTGTNPANGAADISQTPAITVTFSENIEADAGYAGIKLEDAAENDVSISKSINSNVLTITPQSALSYSTTYTVTIPADAVKSTVSETNLAEEYLFSFTIQSAPSGSGGGGGGGGTPAPPTVKDETDTKKEINAVGGGTISLGDVSVSIPSGILPNNATFSIKKMNPGEANNIVPEGLRLKLGSDVYDIATTGIRDFGDNTITIKIPYNPGKIATGEVPVINYYNEQTGEWTALATTAEQGSDGRWYAVVKVNHLTKFAVLSTAVNVPVQPLKVIELTIGSTEARIDGKSYTLAAAPFVKPEASRTLVPLRFISETLGASVEWRGESQEVVIRENCNGQQVMIILTIDSDQALVNNVPLPLDCPAQLHPPGQTFVPLRFVSETLGARVEWEASSNTITITR